MNEERAQAAMPKLYGAPAYARPPVAAVNPVDRPINLDDLPLEAERTSEDQDLLQRLQPHAYESVATTDAQPNQASGGSRLGGRPFRLRRPGRGKG